MDSTCGDSLPSSGARVRVFLRLGSESHSVHSGAGGLLSQQLAEVKEESMKILKSFIASHNVPDQVPDELADGAAEDEGRGTDDNPPKKSKK
ncbi:unnamed protein product [Spirodela intermedia]|uniref:Uncharacterized protein n=2 Tax=Spirodela intermedia TaxID=51605 RepID=A0A7I8KDN7_SPIIN|nr:unnamed protein product [Spirodela intermedia]CAA6659571.1 unnamed protein product [Spirodela intermedia]CAA7395887.1 unnamed protein product [Spirodela intermedia]